MGQAAQSGQAAELQQAGAETKFDSYVSATRLHMMRESRYMLRLIKAYATELGDLEAWGTNPASDTLTYNIAAKQIGGDYRVHIGIDTRTKAEMLQAAITAARLREGPIPFFDDDTLREDLGRSDTRDIGRRISSQLIETNEDMLRFKTQ